MIACLKAIIPIVLTCAYKHTIVPQAAIAPLCADIAPVHAGTPIYGPRAWIFAPIAALLHRIPRSLTAYGFLAALLPGISLGDSPLWSPNALSSPIDTQSTYIHSGDPLAHAALLHSTLHCQFLARSPRGVGDRSPCTPDAPKTCPSIGKGGSGSFTSIRIILPCYASPTGLHCCASHFSMDWLRPCAHCSLVFYLLRSFYPSHIPAHHIDPGPPSSPAMLAG